MYESELDKFLKEYDKRPEATSASRKKEEKKYERIFKLRDKPQPQQPRSDLWEGF